MSTLLSIWWSQWMYTPLSSCQINEFFPCNRKTAMSLFFKVYKIQFAHIFPSFIAQSEDLTASYLWLLCPLKFSFCTYSSGWCWLPQFNIPLKCDQVLIRPYSMTRRAFHVVLCMDDSIHTALLDRKPRWIYPSSLKIKTEGVGVYQSNWWNLFILARVSRTWKGCGAPSRTSTCFNVFRGRRNPVSSPNVSKI